MVDRLEAAGCHPPTPNPDRDPTPECDYDVDPPLLAEPVGPADDANGSTSENEGEEEKPDLRHPTSPNADLGDFDSEENERRVGELEGMILTIKRQMQGLAQHQLECKQEKYVRSQGRPVRGRNPRPQA